MPFRSKFIRFATKHKDDRYDDCLNSHIIIVKHQFRGWTIHAVESSLDREEESVTYISSYDSIVRRNFSGGIGTKCRNHLRTNVNYHIIERNSRMDIRK